MVAASGARTLDDHDDELLTRLVLSGNGDKGHACAVCPGTTRQPRSVLFCKSDGEAGVVGSVTSNHPSRFEFNRAGTRNGTLGAYSCSGGTAKEDSSEISPFDSRTQLLLEPLCPCQLNIKSSVGGRQPSPEYRVISTASHEIHMETSVPGRGSEEAGGRNVGAMGESTRHGRTKLVSDAVS